MQRVLSHAFIAGCLGVLIVLGSVALQVHRKEAEARQSEPQRITRVVLVTAGVAVFYWPIVPLAYGVGAAVGAVVAALRNGVDRRRERTSHQWTMDDD
jgi:hypothetical protein